MRGEHQLKSWGIRYQKKKTLFFFSSLFPSTTELKFCHLILFFRHASKLTCWRSKWKYCAGVVGFTICMFTQSPSTPSSRLSVIYRDKKTIKGGHQSLFSIAIYALRTFFYFLVSTQRSIDRQTRIYCKHCDRRRQLKTFSLKLIPRTWRNLSTLQEECSGPAPS